MVAIGLIALVAAITIGVVISSTSSSNNLAHATATQTQVNTAANTLQRDLSMAKSITLATPDRLEFNYRQDNRDVQGAVFGYIPGTTTDVPANTKTGDLPNFTSIIYVRSFSDGTVTQDVLVTGWDKEGYQGNPLFRYFNKANDILADTSTVEFRDQITRIGFYIAAYAEGRSSNVQIQSSVTPGFVAGAGDGGTLNEPPAVPACPVNLRVDLDQSNRTATVTWGAPEGATSYVIYQREYPSGTPVNSYSINLPTQTILVIDNLVRGMTYEFGIQASGAGGITGECDTVRATVTPDGTEFVNLNSLANLTDRATNNTSDIRNSPVRSGIADYSRVTTNVLPGHRYTVARDLTNLLTWESVPGAAEYIVYRVGTADPIGRVTGNADYRAAPTAFSFQDPDRNFGDSTRYYVVTSNAGGTGIASSQVTLISPPRETAFDISTPDTSTRTATTDAVFNVRAQSATTIGHTAMRHSTTAAEADCSAVQPTSYMNGTGAQLQDPQAPWGSASCYRFVPFNDAGNGIPTNVEVDQKPGKFNIASFNQASSMAWIDTNTALLPAVGQCWTVQNKNTSAPASMVKERGDTRASCWNGYRYGPNDPEVEGNNWHATDGDRFAIGLFGAPQQDTTDLQLAWTRSMNAGAGYDAIRNRVNSRGQQDVGTAGAVSYFSNYNPNPANGHQNQRYNNEMPGSEFTGEVIATALNGLTRSSAEGNGLARYVTVPDIPSALGNEWWTKGNYPFLKVRMHVNTLAKRGFSSLVAVQGEAWYGDADDSRPFDPVMGTFTSTSTSNSRWVDGPEYGGGPSDRREHREQGWQFLDYNDANGTRWTANSKIIGVTGATRGCVSGACENDWQAVPEAFPAYLPGGYYRYNSGGNAGSTQNGGSGDPVPPFTGGTVIVDEGEAISCDLYSESDPLFQDNYGCEYGQGIPPKVQDLINVRTVGDKATISWTAMTNAFAGYVIAVTEEDGTKNTYTTSSNTTTLTLPVNNTSRVIAVAAKNTIKTGPESDPITIRPLTPPVFSVGRSVDNQLEAKASTVDGANAYTVHWRENGGVERTSTNVTIDGATAVATIPNTEGALTNVWFTAQNDSGRTTSLAGSNADFNGLLAPANLRYNVNGNSAIITWDAVAHAEYYLLYQDGNPTNLASGTRVNGIAHTVTVPVNGDTSNIQVRAFNNEPFGESYSKASATLNANGVGTVTGVRASTTNNRSTISWTATPNATEYDVLYRIAGGAQQTAVVAAPATSFAMDVNPAGGQTIDVQVRARKAEGVGTLSAPLSYQTIGKPVIADYKLNGDKLEVFLGSYPGSPNQATLYYQFGTGAIQTRAITVDGNEGNPVTITGVLTQPVSYWVQATESRTNVTTVSVPSDKRTVQGLVAPAGFTAVAEGFNGRASWSALTGATAYEVSYRALGETAWETINTTNLTAAFQLPAIDTEVKVRALKDSGKVVGADSAVAVVKAPVVEKPASVTVNATAGNVSVSWPATANAASYEVTYQVGTATPVTLDRTTTNATFTVPTDGSLVKVSVAGKNHLMTGEAATVEFTPLGQPQVQSYTIVDDILQLVPGSLTGPANQLNVSYQLDGGATVTRQVPAAGGALNIPGLSGASVEFWIQAQGGSGTVTTRSANSGTVTELPLATPANLRVVNVDGAKATIAWDAVANATSYRLYQDGNPDSYASGISVDGTVTVLDVPVNGDTSTIVVRAVRSTSVSGVTGTQYSKQTAPITAKGIGVVSGLNISSLGGTLNLGWNSTPNAQRYEISTDVAGASVVNATATSTSYSRTSLPTAGQAINIKVRAVTDLGAGPWNTATAVLIAKPAITSYSLTGDSLTVAINNPAGNENRHELHYTINGGAEQTVTVGSTGGTRALSAPAGSVVRFWVELAQTGTNLALRSVPSDITQATVLGTPTLNAIARGVQADLSWTAVTGAGLYEVNYRQQGSGTWTKETTTARNLTIDLPAATTEIFVVAVQSATVTQVRGGNSNTMVVTAPVLNAPVNLNYTVNDTAVNVRWDEVQHASNYEVRYTVNGGAVQTVTVATNSADFTAPAGSNLSIQVRATNRLVTGVLSPAFAFTTIAKPTVTGASLMAGTLTLLFDNPAGNETKGTVYYQIGTGEVQSTPLNLTTRRADIPLSGYEGQMVSGWVVMEQEASNLLVTSAQSDKIERAGLAAPVLNWKVVGPDATVTWDAVDLATSYGRQFAIDGPLSGEEILTSRSWTFTIPSGSTANLNVRSAAPNARSVWAGALALRELPAPAGLAANVVGDQATVSWNAVAGAERYVLHYGTPGGTSTSVEVTGTSRAITLPANPAEVWVVAYADGDKRESLPTSKLSVRQLATPTLEGVVVRGDETTLTWNAVADATSYEIDYRVASTGTWASVTQTGTSRTMNLPGVLSEFRVQAVASSTLRSAESNLVTLEALPPAVPTAGRFFTGLADGSTTIAWNAVADADSYDISYRVESGATTVQNVTGTSYDVKVEPGQAVYWQVRSKNRLVSSAYTASAGERTIAQPVLTSYGLVGDDFTYTIANPAGNETNATVFWKIGTGAVQSKALGSAARYTGTVDLPGIAGNAAEVWFSMNQVSGVANIVSAESEHIAIPGLNPPTNFRNTATNGQAATFVWDAVAGAQGYEISYRAVGDTAWQTVTTTGTTRAVTLPASSNEAFVRATWGTTFKSNASDTVTVATIGTTVATVEIVRDGDDALLSWTATPGATAYALSSRPAGTTTWTTNVSYITGTSYTHIMPAASTEYRILPRNTSAFSGVWSATVTADAVAPAMVNTASTNFTATGGDVTLAWGAVTDVTAYDVYYRPTSSDAYVTESVTGTSFAFTHAAGNSVTWQVRAKNRFLASDYFTAKTQQSLATPTVTIDRVAGDRIYYSVNDVAGPETAGTLSYTVDGTTTNVAIPYPGRTSSFVVSGMATKSVEVSAVVTGSATGYSTTSARSATVLAAGIATPTNTRVTGQTGNSITTAWGAVTGATSYQLSYKQASETAWTTVELGNVTTHTMDATGTDMQFQVRARRDTPEAISNGGSVASTSVIAMPTFTVANSGGTGAVVSWGAVANAAYYKVFYRATGSTATPTEVGTTGTSSTITLPSVSTDVWVQAYRSSAALGFASDVAPTQTVTAPTLATPTGVNVDVPAGTNATVNWTAVTNATSYSVGVKIGTGAETFTTVTGTSHAFQVPSANAGQNVVVRVMAKNALRDSAYSANFTFQTIAQPTVSSYTLTAPNTLDLTIANPAGAETATRLYYRINGGATQNIAGPLYSGTYTISGLNSNTQSFEFWVVASQVATGRNIYSVASATTTTAPIAVPTGLKMDRVDLNTGYFSWNAVTGADGYILLYKAVGATTWSQKVIAGGTTVTTSQVLPGMDNLVAIQATTTGGSVVSNESASIAANKIPAPTLSSTASGTTVTLTWSAVPNATRYWLEYREVGVTAWTSMTSSYAGTTHTHQLPFANTEYRVRGITADNSRSLVSATETVAATAPAAPTGLKATANGTAGSLTWNTVSGASSYEIGVTIGTGVETFATSTTAAYTITDALAAGTSVQVRVRAKNAYLDGAWAPTLTFQTIGAPTVNSATITTGNRLNLNVTAPLGQESAMTLYYRVDSGAWQTAAYPVAGGASSITLAGTNTNTTQVITYYLQATQVTADRDITGVATADATSLSMGRPALTGSVSGTTATWSWNAIGSAANYAVYYRNVGVTTWTGTSTTATSFSRTLTPGTPVEVRVVARNGSNTSADSVTVPLETVGNPPSVTGSATSVTGTFSWAAVPGATSYTITYRRATPTADPWVTETITATSKAVSFGTSAGQVSYELYAVANNASGSTAVSNTATVYRLATPTFPARTDDQAWTAFNSTAGLTWNATPNATSYTVYYRLLGSTGTYSSITRTTNSVNYSHVGGALNNSEYELYIVANNAAANYGSSRNSAVEQIIKPAPTVWWTNVTVSSGTLNWEPVPNATRYVLSTCELAYGCIWENTTVSAPATTRNWSYPGDFDFDSIKAYDSSGQLISTQDIPEP